MINWLRFWIHKLYIRWKTGHWIKPIPDALFKNTSFEDYLAKKRRDAGIDAPVDKGFDYTDEN